MTDVSRSAAGERIYAIGDVHGRIDLFAQLLGMVRADGAARGAMPTRIILLGDVVDRGPSSCDLVAQLIALTTRSERILVLKGNHEDAMIGSLDGDLAILDIWLGIGGDATLASWGVDADLLAHRRLADILREGRRRIGEATLAWLRRLPLTARSGDYLFVHAGIRPGVPLKRQTPEDMMWIGADFIQSEARHPAVIVHGHTVAEDGPEFHPRRIGVDTGAYRTGRLTAVGLEGEERWSLSTA